MKCIEISNKTPLTVTVHSVCGSQSSLPSILDTNFTTIFILGIGTELPPVKTERKKESEWEMPSLLLSLKKPMVFKSPNGDGCLTIFIPLEEDSHQVWATLTMLEPCTCLHATESTDTSNTTDTRSETKKPPWSKGDLMISSLINIISLSHFFKSIIKIFE